MHIVQIKYRGEVCYVPVIYPGDTSTGVWRNFPPSTSKLDAFVSISAARDYLGSLGYGYNIDTVIDINLDNVRQWAENPDFAGIDLDELELLDGLVTTYSLEAEQNLPCEVDMQTLYPLWQKVFEEPKRALYKLPNAPVVTEEELQQRINNPVLKKHFLTLIQYFERVVHLHGDDKTE